MSARPVILPCSITREGGKYVVSYVISGDGKTRGLDGNSPRRETVAYCSTLAAASNVVSKTNEQHGIGGKE